MQEFIYYAPTEVVFGKDAEKKTAEEVKNGAGTGYSLSMAEAV